MKNGYLNKLISGAVMIAAAATFVSCDGGGGSSSTWGAYQSPYVSASQFVAGLNNTDLAPTWDESFIELYTDETLRSAIPGEDDWFVIWDAKHNEHKAVSLQYIRSIIYYDYYANSTALASEFRAIENADIANLNLYGDPLGLDYEVVDPVYDIFGNFLWYEGVNSGFAYEDEDETTDVNLMMKDKEQKKFFKQAEAISYTYKVGVDTAMSLVTLKNKVGKMMGKKELTKEDQQVLLKDMERLTGKKAEDFMAAAEDAKLKQKLVKDVAEKLGTSAQNLENQLLPDLVGLHPHE